VNHDVAVERCAARPREIAVHDHDRRTSDRWGQRATDRVIEQSTRATDGERAFNVRGARRHVVAHEHGVLRQRHRQRTPTRRRAVDAQEQHPHAQHERQRRLVVIHGERGREVERARARDRE